MSLLKLGGIQVGQSNTASNNFHWRNLLDGLLRLSRGNAGSPITDVMTVNADNSVSFPGGISGYVSPEQTITTAGQITLTHLLGRAPAFFRVAAICKTAEHGYSVGDVLEVQHVCDVSDSDVAVRGMSLTSDSTNIYIRYVANATVFPIINKTNGATAPLTNANWRLIVRAW